MSAKYDKKYNFPKLSSKHSQVFLILLIFTLCNVSKEFTIGKPHYKFKILVILDISDYESLHIVREIVESLKYACFKPIEEKILFINIMITSYNYDDHTRFMLSYLEYLDQMSESFLNCFSCSLNKFFRAMDFLHRVSKEYFRLVNLDKQEFMKEINKVVPYISKREFNRIINDIYLNDMQSYSNFFFKIFPSEGPLVFMNSVIINEPHKVDREYWKNIFRNNFDLEKCKNKEEFFKYLTYYSE
jgi:hypothetical protein